ncbi:sugar phosphate isomerase/epimerase family protein [Propionibacterium sp.]|uniref:sugar phosphate isomerase/epimerase family protein n=1 Tax=Propionibacterium sp. TaxID=1977903 RepID=UPI0039E8FFD1
MVSKPPSGSAHIPRPDVSLSTSSVYPEHTADCFAIAAEAGYDGVEIMVGIDAASADVPYLGRLSTQYTMPIVAIHAPCLLLSQNVWGPDPWDKVRRSCAAATDLGADIVVLHPPLRWQRGYASGFVEGVREISEQTGVTVAVENMYPWRTPGRPFQAYAPSWDPTAMDYDALTLDLSHAATSQRQSLEMAKAWGPRLRHVHLTDGSDSPMDEHLMPGEGDQNAWGLLEYLVNSDYQGHIVLEVNTRKADDHEDRLRTLTRVLDETRAHLWSAVQR